MSDHFINSIDAHTNFVTQLRDQSISLTGIPVTFRIPKTEMDVDAFGDLIPLTDASQYNEFNTYIIPRFPQYYTMINSVSKDQEKNIPLECVASTQDHIPRGSEVDVYLSDSNGDYTLKTFTVNSNQISIYRQVKSRVITLVPKRRD